MPSAVIARMPAEGDWVVSVGYGVSATVVCFVVSFVVGIVVKDCAVVAAVGVAVIFAGAVRRTSVSYTHLRAHETDSYLVCRLLLEKKKYTRDIFRWYRDSQ